MAAPGKKFFGAGLASARFYAARASDGLPNATSATVPLDGTLIGGPISLSLELGGAPDIISHPGNNTTLQYQSFPGITPASGTLTLSRRDMDTLATLAATSVYTEGEINAVHWGTSKAGDEIDVWIVIYQPGYVAGVEAWGTYAMRCRMYAQPRGFTTRDRQDITYNITPIITTTEITGRTLSTGSDGCTSTTMTEYESNKRLHFAFFLANGTASSFPLSSTLYADTTAGMAVLSNGVLQTAGAFTSLTTSLVHFTAAPTTSALICVKYNLADTAVDVD